MATTRTGRDAGSVTVLVATAVAAVVVAVTLAVGRLGAAVAEGGRARTAADAAALASVRGGRAVAARVASANGGVLVGWHRVATPDGVTDQVVVRVGDTVATARATGGP